jgi:hypothetical protein
MKSSPIKNISLKIVACAIDDKRIFSIVLWISFVASAAYRIVLTLEKNGNKIKKKKI